MRVISVEREKWGTVVVTFERGPSGKTVKMRRRRWPWFKWSRTDRAYRVGNIEGYMWEQFYRDWQYSAWDQEDARRVQDQNRIRNRWCG